MHGKLRALPVVGLLLLFAGLAAFAPAEETRVAALPPATKKKVDFKRDIAPIFKERCEVCHGAKQQMGGLRLDAQEAALAGGNSGKVILPGASADSKLIQLVAGLIEGKVMPLGGERLTAEQVGLLRAWIDQGAEWAEDTAVATKETEKPKSSHWAFIPPARPAVPKVRQRAWVRNPIDAFVLGRLEAEGVEPSPEGDGATLMRRLSLDLIGLPPTPDEVAQFLADRRPDAYERLVDRLMASPHYGEKWARPWLDLARYADSDGYEKDYFRPYAWRWRDWVISAINSNIPFDAFTVEQLAGDLLPHATLDQKVATGFNRNTLTNREGGVDLEEFRVEQVIDRTATLGTVWLGLTVGCARCHDHKYDPIAQREFYQLYAFFNTAREANPEAPLPGEVGPFLARRAEYEKKRDALLAEYHVPELIPDWEEKTRQATLHPGVDVPYDISLDTLRTLLTGGPEILFKERSKRTPKEQDRLTHHYVRWFKVTADAKYYEQLKFKELDEKLTALEEEYPELSEVQVFEDNPKPPKTHVLIRGDFRNPGIEVQPATPAVLPPLAPDPKPTRLRLAEWLVSKENPLTARVTVNRIWQEVFGRGIVETSEDFGTRGERPTHPELLDWLATEFIVDWDMKRMTKLIVMSAAYRQSSTVRKDLETRDPYNKLLARQSRLRLPAEIVRDSLLASSGLLDPTMGGKSIRPPLPAGVLNLAFGAGDWISWKDSPRQEQYRRGIYLQFQRSIPYPQLMTFNAPDRLVPCTRRERTTTPLQALTLLNDPVLFEASQGLAARVLRDKPGSLDDRLDYAFELCLARRPKPAEKDRLAKYYYDQKEILEREPDSIEKLFPPQGVAGVDRSEAAVWAALSSALLNLDEFLTRE